ncbi:FkbM family methyltransferase [Dyella sp. 2RAB6]|uniref:FkbM family methyltransferase n=1 Tax=Dyella sp. 2RAB6 TaxID=3232992 RepID=UPI003F8E5C0C
MNVFNSTAQEPVAPLLWTVRYGVVSATSSQHPAARSLQLYGEWAEAEIDLLSSVLQEKHTVMQFGGEYGAHTLWLARVVGEAGKVYVAEPARIGFQQLCATAALNGLTNVYTLNQWLGRSGAAAPLSTLPGGASLKCEADETVRPVAIDDLGLGGLDLLKINVPGSTIALLQGAVETVRKHRPVIYTRLEPEQALAEVRAIKELGYRCWSHAPHMYNPGNIMGQGENVFPGRVLQNVIAMPVESGAAFDQLMEV